MWWDVAAAAPICITCHEGPKVEARVEGVAGASAQHRYDDLVARRERVIRAAHPRIGGLLVKTSQVPQSTMAWSKGAAGERVVGAALNRLATKQCIVLHDRQIPGTRANIDHLVVSARGVIVVNAKHYSGRLEKREMGSWSRSDTRLFVAGRDRSRLLDDARREAATVRSLLGPAWASAPVVPILCFTGVEIGLFVKPFVISDVVVGWPRAMASIVLQDGPLSATAVNDIAAGLSASLPAAVG